MRALIFYVLLLMVCWGCSSPPDEQTQSATQLEAAGKTADFLQMTQDHQGNIIAWWIEKDQETKEQWVFLSQSSGPELSFESSHKIPGTRNISTGGENMPKLVVKPDGAYILVFSRPNEQSSARFASSVLYAQSFDEGNTWSEPELIHSDTNPDNSHAFPTATLLPNGEVGAVWLDGRNHLEHSELYFAQTNGQKGFGEDKRIGGPSCQCCKLYMYVDDDQTLHLVYRGLTKDNIRDIAHIRSDDSGKNFSSPALVSRDNWQIMACPHNGPAITQTDNDYYAIWYTMGGEEGLYFANSSDSGQTFSSRKKLTLRAKHPYIASLEHSALAIWDEVYNENDKVYQRVKMSRISEKGTVTKTEYLSPAGVEASMPYLLEMDNENVVATWTQYTQDNNKLYYQLFSENS